MDAFELSMEQGEVHQGIPLVRVVVFLPVVHIRRHPGGLRWNVEGLLNGRTRCADEVLTGAEPPPSHVAAADAVEQDLVELAEEGERERAPLQLLLRRQQGPPVVDDLLDVLARRLLRDVCPGFELQHVVQGRPCSLYPGRQDRLLGGQRREEHLWIGDATEHAIIVG
jgi:hypothetical protein